MRPMTHLAWDKNIPQLLTRHIIAQALLNKEENSG